MVGFRLMWRIGGLLFSLCWEREKTLGVWMLGLIGRRRLKLVGR